MAKKANKEYEEVEGVQCEIKNPARKGVVRFYQNNLREEVDRYIADHPRMTDKNTRYLNAMKVNVILAPFVLGWLRKPEDNDEYLVIKGYMTMKELDAKRNKSTTKVKKVAKKRPKKATATAVKPTKKAVTTSKPVSKGKSLNRPKTVESPKKVVTKKATTKAAPKKKGK